MTKRIALVALIIAAGCGPIASYTVRTSPGPASSTLVEVEPLTWLTRAEASAAFHAAADSTMRESGCRVWSASEPRTEWHLQQWDGPLTQWPGASGLVTCVMPYRPTTDTGAPAAQREGE